MALGADCMLVGGGLGGRGQGERRRDELGGRGHSRVLPGPREWVIAKNGMHFVIHTGEGRVTGTMGLQVRGWGQGRISKRGLQSHPERDSLSSSPI